jgi:predicted nucleic acid-binding protein
MLRVMIDTTVWVSGIFWHDLPHRILEMWKAGDFEIIVSEAILEAALTPRQRLLSRISLAFLLC